MKRAILILILGLGLVLPTVSGAQASIMGVGKIGIGGYGVANIPVAVEDADPGGLFGLRARVGVLPILVIEPSVNFFSNGDGKTDSGIVLEAPKLTGYALNALLKSGGIGFSMYFTAGLGWTKVDMPGGLGEENETTYNLGLGAEIGLGPLAVDVSPRLFIVNTASGGSRKHLALMAGVNYYFN